jgi:hypothetical protein
MTNSVQAALSRTHWAALKRLHGEAIVYQRADLSIEVEKAVATRPYSGLASLADNIEVNARQMDWLIGPEDLIDESGDRIVPQRGDRITRADGHSACTWRRIHTEDKP